jgi:hypothetical protein
MNRNDYCSDWTVSMFMYISIARMDHGLKSTDEKIITLYIISVFIRGGFDMLAIMITTIILLSEG